MPTIICLLKQLLFKEQKQHFRILSKAYPYLQAMTKTPVKFRKNWYKVVGWVSPFNLSWKMPEKWLSSTCEKVTKNNLRIISNTHSNLQTMTKPLVKFQKNRYKTVGEVAPTGYPLSIHFVIDIARKMAKLTCEKGDKNNRRIKSKPHAYLQTMTSEDSK